MQTHQIHISQGGESVCDIRRSLFRFPEVLDVFATGGRDVLVVVYAGHPRPGEWLRALRAVGYETPARSHPDSAPRPVRRELVPSVVTLNGTGACDGE